VPSIAHEATVELLRRNPQLAAALLASAGVQIPAGASAVLADSNLSVPAPTELRADVLTVHEGVGGKLVIVTEVQKDPPGAGKRRAWVAYTALAHVEHQCDAALVVIALRPGTARASGKPILVGGSDRGGGSGRPRGAPVRAAVDRPARCRAAGDLHSTYSAPPSR
jgi:hypothetical protein